MFHVRSAALISILLVFGAVARGEPGKSRATGKSSTSDDKQLAASMSRGAVLSDVFGNGVKISRDEKGGLIFTFRFDAIGGEFDSSSKKLVDYWVGGYGYGFQGCGAWIPMYGGSKWEWGPSGCKGAELVSLGGRAPTRFKGVPKSKISKILVERHNFESRKRVRDAYGHVISEKGERSRHVQTCTLLRGSADKFVWEDGPPSAVDSEAPQYITCEAVDGEWTPWK